MSFTERINADIKAAMLAKEKEKLAAEKLKKEKQEKKRKWRVPIG